MGLFRKKNKPKKVRDKQGCLMKVLFVVLLIVIVVFGTLGGLNMAKESYGDTLQKIADYIMEFNDVPTIETLHNRFGTESLSPYIDFQNQATECGFSGDNLEDGPLSLETSLRMRDNVFGNAISRYLNSKTELLSIVAFTITSDNTITIIFEYNLKQVKVLLEDVGSIIPDRMFITNTFMFDIKYDEFLEINQITATNTMTILNNMSKEKSDELFKYLKNVNSDKITTGLFNTYDTIVFTILNSIGMKTESNLSLTYEDGMGYISYNKK